MDYKNTLIKSLNIIDNLDYEMPPLFGLALDAYENNDEETLLFLKENDLLDEHEITNYLVYHGDPEDIEYFIKLIDMYYFISSIFHECIRTRNINLLNYIYRKYTIKPDTINQYLPFAVYVNNVNIVKRLLEFGGNKKIKACIIDDKWMTVEEYINLREEC